MGFNKPFRAVPVRLGPHYLARERRRSRLIAAKVLGIAVAAGLAAGGLAALYGNGAFSDAAGRANDVALRHGYWREKAPTAGAYYSGCNDARAAGVAPLFAGEPGYRPGMDGDGDGVACEPYRGPR